MGLHPIDIAIILLYLAGVVALGVYLGRFIRTGKDYFLAGKRLPWWAIGMSLVVSDIGAVDMISLAAAAFAYGIGMANFDWIGCVPAMIVAAFVFVPYFWISGVYTIPEYLGRRYNDAVRLISTLVWIVYMVLFLGMLLYMTALMFQNVVGSM